MKKLLLLLVLASFSAQVRGVPSFDPFADASDNGGTTYDVGANLVGQNNSTLFGPWYLRGGNSGSTQPTIAAGNLSYPNMPESLGNSVLIGPDSNPSGSMSAFIDLNLPAQHSDTVYYSFLLKVTDLSAVPDYPTNNAIAAFGDDPRLIFSGSQIARLGTRLLTKKVGDGYVLGLSRTANASDSVYEPNEAAHNVNEVVLVVACYQRIANVETNVNLWVNPPTSSLGSNQPPAPTLQTPYPATFTGAGHLNNDSARAFGILCQYASIPSAVIDDVRVGINDWSYITGGDPAILTQPVSLTLPEGVNANFTVTARGTPTLTYQWYKDGITPLSDGGKISGATTASLTINNISTTDLGDYSVTVMNGLGNPVTSIKARLAFNDPLIVSQPQSFTGNFGTNALFEVAVTGTAPFTYQWHKEGAGPLSDGGNILGSHSNVLAISGIAFPDSGNYFVTISNAVGGSVNSDIASLVVVDPYITAEPVSVVTNAGADVQFHVAAAGTSPEFFSYQWYKNDVIIFDSGNVSGTFSDTLTISGVTAANEGSYSAIVNGPFSNAVSASATLTVLTPASTAIQPRSRAVLAGAKTAFVVRAGGSGPFTYQWQWHGTNIPGATAEAYVIPNAQADLAGDYRVVISNSFSSTTSDVATLTVSNSLSLAETNLIIVRIGDGANGLTINGSAMFLDQYTINGTYVNTITIPDDGPLAMAAIGWDNINGVNSGSTTGTSLTRSLDGRFMVIAGYKTNLNYGASLMASSAANVPKAIATIDSFGQIALPVISTDPVFNNSYWRAGVTDGTNNYWGIAGIAGTYYFGFDDAPTLIQNTFINSRSMGLYNGDIYCATAASPTGLLKIDGMPHTSVTPTVLFNASSGTYDMAVSPNGNLIYLADQRNVGNNGGIQRWEFDGSTWNLAYTINTGFGNVGPRYIDADFSGPNPVLYVTSNDQTFDNNRLIKVVDTGAGSAGTALANAGANQTFRGIHFGPVPNTVLPRPTIGFTQSGNNLILTWSGTYTLMSSTNVAGPYVDVSGATSPYTNNTSAGQRFFGLRQ